MPLGAKLVIGCLVLSLFLDVVSLFTATSPLGGDIVSIVIGISLLTGLHTRQRAAWRVARFLAGLGIAFGGLFCIIAAVASNTTFAIAASAVATLAIASGLFYLLGRDDSRDYFNAPRKA